MPSQGQPNYGQQPDLFLARTFTGRPVGAPAMGTAPLNATVVQATTDGNGKPAVIVTVGGFGDGSQAQGGASAVTQFVCSYEPRFGSGSSAKVPPAKTQCLVAFNKNPGPTNGWVVAFYGWPD